MNLWFLFPENTNTHYVFHLSLIFIKACYVRSIALPNLSSIILPIISHRFHFHMFHNISLVTCLINDITLLAIVVEQENVNCNNVFFLSFFQKLFYKQLSKLERRHVNIRSLDPLYYLPQNIHGDKCYNPEVIQNFHWSLHTIHQEWEDCRIEKQCTGRPRLISTADGLGLVLAWTRAPGSIMVLELIVESLKHPLLTICIFAWSSSSGSYKGWMTWR